MEGNGDGGDGVCVGRGWGGGGGVFLKLARQGVVSNLCVLLADVAF